MDLNMWAVLRTFWQIFGGVALTEIPGLLRVSFPVICEEKTQNKTNQMATIQDCSIFNADIKGEQMPGWHRRGKAFIKKINNTERHKHKKLHTPSLPDYCMLKWHAYTIEQSAFIHRLNRDKGVPTGVLRCLECSSMQIYREREGKCVRRHEQRLKLIKRNHIHVKSTKRTSGDRTGNVVHLSKTHAH